MRKTAMPWIAAGRGPDRPVLTYYLLGASQMSWPLKTAGMPIVSNWTNLIIIFEMTMLSAILATVVTLLVSAQAFPAAAARCTTRKSPTATSSSASRTPRDGAKSRTRARDRRRSGKKTDIS